MTAAVTCFLSSKGGSGKTVTASSLGTFLSSLGFRVLLADTDAATNGMTLLYIESLLTTKKAQDSRNFGLFEAASGTQPTAIEITKTLHLMPASYVMRDTEKTDPAQFRTALRGMLGLRDSYDFIFLDAQAGADVFAQVTAAESDQCIMVSEYDPVSVQGIERLKVLFSTVLDGSNSWILFNKILPEFAAAIGDGLSIARYLPPISWDAEVVRAFARRDLAINLDLPNAFTLAISQLAYALFPQQVESAIEKWRGSSLVAASTPVEERLLELFAVRNKMMALERRRASTARIFAAGTIAATSAILLAFLLISSSGQALIGELAATPSITATLLITLTGLAALAASPITEFLKRTLGLENSASDERGISELTQEIRRLETTLEATRTALKFSRDTGGIYKRLRTQRSERAD
jgi:cellulose biosynthesis protein BcsQ